MIGYRPTAGGGGGGPDGRQDRWGSPLGVAQPCALKSHSQRLGNQGNLCAWMTTPSVGVGGGNVRLVGLAVAHRGSHDGWTLPSASKSTISPASMLEREGVFWGGGRLFPVTERGSTWQSLGVDFRGGEAENGVAQLFLLYLFSAILNMISLAKLLSKNTHKNSRWAWRLGGGSSFGIERWGTQPGELDLLRPAERRCPKVLPTY